MIKIKFEHGGQFQLQKNKLCYDKKLSFGIERVDPDLLSRIELVGMLEEKGITDVRELWYCQKGKKIFEGLKEIKSDRDIVELCDNVGKSKLVVVFVVQADQESPLKYLIATPTLPAKRQEKESLVHQPLEICGPISSSTSIPSKNKGKKPLETPIPNPNIKEGEIEEGDEQKDEEDLDDSSDSDGDVNGSDSSDIGEEYLPPPFASDSEDDQFFSQNVDRDVYEEELNCDEVEDETDVLNVRVEDDGYASHSTDEDGTKRKRFPQFNPLVDFKGKIQLCTGMIFATKDIFRKALAQYSIENGGDYYFLHNDNLRVSVYCLNKCKCPLKSGRKVCVPGCMDKFCGFKANARRMKVDGSFQLKSFEPKHSCGWQQDNRKVTATWLAEKYLEHYREDPQWRIKFFISTIKREYNVIVGYHKAWKARFRAIMMTQGFAPKQYAKVYDYAGEIMKRNPGSSVFIKPELGPERPLFQRLYVCLDACKRGFLAGCRPVVGLDGCHLKGAYTGQMFTAVAMDGNHHIFPIAFAVVEAERKDTWIWFIENLMNDIGGKPLTFMSDRQKVSFITCLWCIKMCI